MWQWRARCCVTTARCLRETLHCSKKASELTLIAFHSLPRIKQLAEDFASKIAKKLSKTAGHFYAMVNFNCEFARHDFALVLAFKGNTVK